MIGLIFVYSLNLLASAVIVGSIFLVHIRHGLTPWLGFSLTSILLAILFALVGIYGAHIVIGEHYVSQLDVNQDLAYLYSPAIIGVIFGGILGIPIFASIRKITEPDPGRSTIPLILILIVFTIIISIGLFSLLFFYGLWAGG